MSYPEPKTQLLPIPEPPLMRHAPALPVATVDYSWMPAQEARSSLLHLFELLARQKWTMLAFVLLAMLAAGGVSLLLEPLYESTATVRIDRHATGGPVGQDASEMSPINDMDQIMATQVEIIQSDPVLRPVAEKYNLLGLERQFKGLKADEIRNKRAAPIVLKRFKVMRPPNTYLIRVTYRANSRQLAAQVTNALVASYISHAFDSRDRTYAQVAASIQRELDSLRAKMEASSSTLADFEKELNMVDPEQGSTIQAARLQQLNTEFTTAQADRLRKEAILKALKDANTIPAAQASAQGETLNHALDRLNDARQQFASIRAIYGENYSEYRKAGNQVDELQRQVEQLRSGVGDQVNVEYQQAVGREGRLEALVNSTKLEVDRLSARALEYAQIKRDAENDKKLYEDLVRRTAEEDINHQFQDATIQVDTPALPADKKAFPNITLNLALAFVFGSILSVVWAVLADAVDTTLSDPEDVATRLNVHVLGVIPATRNLMSPAAAVDGTPLRKRSIEANERFAESIRGLRTSIGLATMDRPVRSMLVTSAEPSEGKSTTAANLAWSFAQIGKRVLLVDADMRAPTVHKHFQIRGEVGLSDVLTHRASWREAMIKIDPYSLYVVPAGPVSRKAADMLARGTAELFDQICREFDVVIVDAPPLLGFSESHELAGMADSVILVTKAEKTRGKSVAKALRALIHARANIMGLVMNQVKSSATDYFYGYGYGKNAEQVTAQQRPAGTS
jgi:polysaccharide biosynthesis transport protein